MKRTLDQMEVQKAVGAQAHGLLVCFVIIISLVTVGPRLENRAFRGGGAIVHAVGARNG